MNKHITSSWVIAALLFLLAFGVYANALWGDFIGDDFFFIVYNRGIETFVKSGEFFSSTARTAINELQFDIYRPLTVLSFAATRFLFGLNPMPYHFINNLLHALNTVLLFFLFRKITGEELRAAFAAAIFAVHPVQTEAVAWISGRGNVQYTFFLLLSFLAFARWRDGNKGSRWFYVASLVLYILSMFSKEHGIVLPALMFVWILTIKRNHASSSKSKYSALIPFFITGAAFLATRTIVLGQIGQMAPLGGLGQILWSIQATGRYLKLAFFPWPLSMDPELPSILYGTETGLLLVAIILSIYFPLRMRNRSPLYPLGMLWFFFGLLPVIHIIPIKVFMAERFLYLSIAGFALFITELIFNAGMRFCPRMKTAVVLVLLVALFSTLTIIRNRDWTSPFSINQAELQINTESKLAFYNLGVDRLAKNDLDGAAAYFLKAMGELGGIDMYARNDIVRWIFLARGDVERAFALNADNLKLYPDEDFPYVMQGSLYLTTGNFKAAEAMFLTAMHLNPESYYAVSAMAEICRLTGRPEEAEKFSKKASQLNPFNEVAPRWR